MKPYFWFWCDVITEFSYNAGQGLLGYMIGAGVLSMPTKAGWLAAGITGIIGTANHLRAMRKSM